jgi:hypothetical protein
MAAPILHAALAMTRRIQVQEEFFRQSRTSSQVGTARPEPGDIGTLLIEAYARETQAQRLRSLEATCGQSE